MYRVNKCFISNLEKRFVSLPAVRHQNTKEKQKRFLNLITKTVGGWVIFVRKHRTRKTGMRPIDRCTTAT